MSSPDSHVPDTTAAPQARVIVNPLWAINGGLAAFALFVVFVMMMD